MLKFAMILTTFSFVLGACTTPETSTTYGVQQDHVGFVPARTAVIPCIAWPTGARFEKLPLSNAKDAEVQEICKKMDEYVLAGFQNQPYMKGSSPKAVAKALEIAKIPDHLSKIQNLWKHSVNDCKTCANVPSFYMQSIAARPEWRLWLNDLGKALGSADSVLMPFVIYARETRFNDRGLHVAERSAEIAVLLVDANNGLLLWSGSRESATANQRLETKDVRGDPDFPSWESLWGRLFIEALWKDYPGRQVLE